MFDIKDFNPYNGQEIDGYTALLVWTREVGYQFIKTENYSGQTIFGVRE